MVFTVYGRVGLVEEGRTFCKRRDADDIGRVSAAGPLGVVGVDGAAADGLDGVFHEACFVQGVGMNGHLDVGGIRYP